MKTYQSDRLGKVTVPERTPADEGMMAAKRENASDPRRATCKVTIDITQDLGPEMTFENIEVAIQKGLENYGYRVHRVEI